MTTREIAACVEIAAPVRAVWATVTDWSHQGEWMLGRRVRVISGDGRSVGSRLSGCTGLLDVVRPGVPHRLAARPW